jgi:hypothetical protein
MKSSHNAPASVAQSRLLQVFLAATAALLAAEHAYAGGGPENHLLVVNSASQNSLAIANHYIALRDIPSSNVIYIGWKGDLHTTDVETFREQILKPIVQTAHERGLTAHLDGIVYSSDFPYKVDFKDEFSAKEKPLLKEPLTPIGSLNGLTFYYQFVLSKNPSYIDFRRTTNAYFRPVVGGKQTAPTRGFRGWSGWGAKGEMLEAGGQRYLLSTMLGMTVAKTNTVEEVIDYLSRSAKADGSAPRGTIYFADVKDPRSQARVPAFEPAIAELKKLGIQGAIDSPPPAIGMPANKPDIAGLVLGIPNFYPANSGSTILPGAICENLTSFGADPNQKFQTLLTDFLRAGAAGSSGTPVEPLLVVEKFPHPFIQVHYARGCTLAEAFYQSVAAPYQLVIVGDPLCRPWAKIPKIEVAGVAADGTLSGKVSLKPSAEGGAAEVDRFEIYLDGGLIGHCKKGESFELDTAAHSDGAHELRVVGAEAGPIETQGRAILPVTFANHGRTMTFNAPTGRVTLGQRIKLSAKAQGARQIIFYTAGRELARISGASGTTAINSDTLGAGPVTLRAIAIGSGGAETHVLATPVSFRIEPKR